MSEARNAPIAVAIAGASGRMGRLLIEHILEADDVRLVGALEHPRSPEVGTDVGALVGRPTGVRIVGDPRRAMVGADVVIDFSSPTATPSVVRAATEAGVACVVGTTAGDERRRAPQRLLSGELCALVTVDLYKNDKRTRLEFRQPGPDSEDPRESHIGGWCGSMDKLADALDRC